jgi:hypothetical protein
MIEWVVGLGIVPTLGAIAAAALSARNKLQALDPTLLSQVLARLDRIETKVDEHVRDHATSVFRLERGR